jgi:GntR family transcriptional regulator
VVVLMLVFALDARSSVPTYVQLQQQVKHAMRTGVLRPGDQLPSAREVVLSLSINPNTVLKAYRELERGGLIEVRQGQGTFVAADLMTIAAVELAKLRHDLGRWIRAASGLGMERGDMLELFTAEVDAGHWGQATG